MHGTAEGAANSEKPHREAQQALGNGKCCAVSVSGDERESEEDAVEHASCQDLGEPVRVKPEQSLDLKRTASNALSKIASKITTTSRVEPPPDGGLKAWTQVAMGWLVIFITWGWVNSYGAFQSYYTQTLGVSASTISWIGSVQNFLTFFVGAFTGRLLDAGLFIPTLAVGGVLQLLGIFMMSLSTTYWQLMITQGVMTGLGGGMFFTPAMGLIGTYFSRRRALAVGITTTGNSAGGMIYPVLVQQLLPKIGFAWTARVLGFLNLGLLAIVMALMRPRLPPRKAGPMLDFSAFREPTYAFFVAGLFFVIWPIYYTFYYLSSFGTEVIGLPFSTGITLTIIVNGAGMPFRVIPPFFADRWGQLNTLIPIIFVLVIVAFSWIAVSTSGGVYTYTVFYGATSGAFQCLIPSTVASITPDMSMFGTRLGMAFSTLSFAALTGPSLGGALLSAMDGKYLGAQVWAGLSTALAWALIIAARTSKVGVKMGVRA
ncbi:MFS general substrate transporter [Lecanosticta acicola]|uniref:MFS general substrate transporter n=1 Tax=Lecanosticta acicola TaxID=111012 RepID=A0AAI8W0I2_9PEZI|nr:MFS general substrate transporter [Lecanosticta acicola]